MINKRDFIFLYENQWNNPNGDPFTGEQRFDGEIQKILVSDVRIKRFIRDEMTKFLDTPLYYNWDVITAKKLLENIKTKKMSGSAFKFKEHLLKKGIIQTIDEAIASKKKSSKKEKCSENEEKSTEINLSFEDLFLEFIDVRLFGGILTEVGQNMHKQGAVQFKNLNSSLNKCRPEVFQTTTIFPSNVIENVQGSIGINSLIPYSLVQVVGWLDEITAEQNNLSEEDIEKMLYFLWMGVANKNSRSKSGASPLFLGEIIYSPLKCKFSNKTVYRTTKGIDTLIQLESENDFNIRNSQDYKLKFEKLIEASKQDNVEKINFYTEDNSLKELLSQNPKFVFKNLFE